MAVRENLRRAVTALPSGDGLGQRTWERRHAWVCLGLWAHAAILPLYGILQGWGVLHSLLEAGALVGGLAALASSPRLSRAWRAMAATTGLVAASAVLVHLSHGLIEMHFHFFVMIVVISLYQSWRPFLLALGLVVLHHGAASAVDPAAVYNHPAALADPWTWALVHGAFLLAESAACLVIWRVSEDVLERERAAQQSLVRIRDDLAAAQRLASLGSWEWDLAADAWSMSRESYRIFGFDSAEPPPPAAVFELIEPSERDRVAAALRAAADSGEAVAHRFRIMRPDGTPRTVYALGEFELDEEGRPTRLAGTCQDVTDREALEQEIEYRAFYDALTGLANRSLFLDRLGHALAVGQRAATPVSVVYLDLDDFKTVNDSLGHRVGDDLLIEVAERLRSVVREADTVARFGGDEFAVLLEGTRPEEARQTAERILAGLYAPVTAGPRNLNVAASIGIAGSDHGHGSEQVIKHADLAMYAAKRESSPAYVVFHPEMAEQARERFALEGELEEAIAREEFILHYQPIIDLETGQLDGIEALVRWEHPVRGELPPSAFIQLAEETGHITPLGAWVTREATVQAAMLQQALGRPVRVSVNLAAPQLHGDLVGMVEDALARSGLAADLLTLEITETCLMSHQHQAVPKLEALRALGVHIAIDDFGTGYSSLDYLRQLPIDMLKIDRAFVNSITEGREESALAHAIVDLARIFGLQTTAEGIETPEQARLLRQLGCDHGQGFLYSRPLPVGDILAESLAATLHEPEVPV